MADDLNPNHAPMRLKHRPGHFIWRGDEYDFHRLQDGPSLACLDRDTPLEQLWLLHSGWTISPTGNEVRDIIRQVHGIVQPVEWNEGGEARPVQVTPDQPAPPPPDPVIQYRDTPETLAERDDLRRRLEEAEAKLEASRSPPPEAEMPEEKPQQLPPDPESAKLALDPEDLLFDAPASDEETLDSMASSLMDADAAGRDRIIFGMSPADRGLLSARFKREVDFITNEKMRGKRLNDFDEEQYQLKLALYHALAQKGDGS